MTSIQEAILLQIRNYIAEVLANSAHDQLGRVEDGIGRWEPVTLGPAELANFLGVSRARVRQEVAALVESGALVEMKSYPRWTLPEEVARYKLESRQRYDKGMLAGTNCDILNNAALKAAARTLEDVATENETTPIALLKNAVIKN